MMCCSNRTCGFSPAGDRVLHLLATACGHTTKVLQARHVSDCTSSSLTKSHDLKGPKYTERLTSAAWPWGPSLYLFCRVKWSSIHESRGSDVHLSTQHCTAAELPITSRLDKKREEPTFTGGGGYALQRHSTRAVGVGGR